MKDTLRRGNSNMSEEEDVIGNLDLEDIVGHYVQEYDSIDQTLDQLNNCLDELENKNDNLRARIQEFLSTSRQYRLEMSNNNQSTENQQIESEIYGYQNVQESSSDHQFDDRNNTLNEETIDLRNTNTIDSVNDIDMTDAKQSSSSE